MESLYPDSRQTEADWKGKYRIDGRSLTVFLKGSDLEKAKRYLEEMSSMDEDMEKEVDLDAMPLPGFSGTDLDPWIYFHLEHDWLGTYLRCELYDSWNGGECDAVNCTDGPEQITEWLARFPGDYPYDTLAFELREEGMDFCNPVNMEEKEMEKDVKKESLLDTIMTWRITALIVRSSTKEKEREALLQDIEKCRASILDVYPGVPTGSSLKENLDGSIQASVFKECLTFGFESTPKEGMWHRIVNLLFRGTVDQLKEYLVVLARDALVEMAKDAVYRNGSADILTATGSASEVGRDCYGSYESCVKLCDGSRAIFGAELYGNDQGRFDIFELGGAIREAERKGPGLPAVLVHKGKVIGDPHISVDISDFLDYDYNLSGLAFTSREEFKDYIDSTFKWQDEEAARKFCQEALDRMAPYWTKVLLIRVD